MVVLLKIVQVILALSLLVLFHEFGHYTFAKLFKTRVEKFYLFFNPKFSLVKFKRFGGKWHCKFLSPNEDAEWDAHPEQTEYGIGWLPFGGYCKIAGMIDESMDTEAMKLPPQPYEFRTKPAWQRFFIMFGGVLFNFILAIILYAAIFNHWGEEYLRNENAIYGIAVNDLSSEIGFRDGDRILAFDGQPIDNFSSLQVDLVRSQAREATVLRDGDTLTIAIDPDYLPAMLNTPGMFDLAFPFVVKEVQPESPNAGADLQPGDAVTGINGQPMFIVQQIQRELARHRGEGITADIHQRIQPADRHPGGRQKDLDHHQGIRAGTRPHLLAQDPGLQIRGQLHRHRPYLPRHLGLVPVLVALRPALHHAGRDEPPADPRTGRRAHPVPDFRDDHRPQALRQIHGRGGMDRYGAIIAAHGAGLRKRHPESLLINKNDKI